jgi:uncharacterized membrane protein YsdA (DUF1294 family)
MILYYYLIAINVMTFLAYGLDKLKAKKGKWRIPESTLLLLAITGGSIGALLGMKVWHHKTMHKKFKYGIPLIILLQLGVLLYLTRHLLDMSGMWGCGG